MPSCPIAVEVGQMLLCFPEMLPFGSFFALSFKSTFLKKITTLK